MDIVTLEKRSAIMGAVPQKDTGPELLLRKALFARGYRYRLHAKNLPGRPDIVFPGRRAAVFVHGCFWHGHDCRAGRRPSSNTGYWLPKIAENRKRDARIETVLRDAGWRVMAVWECELKEPEATLSRVEAFLAGVGEM